MKKDLHTAGQVHEQILVSEEASTALDALFWRSKMLPWKKHPWIKGIYAEWVSLQEILM